MSLAKNLALAPIISFGYLSGAAAQIPPDGTVTLTDGGMYFDQTEPYSANMPYAKLHIGAVHHPGGGNAPFDAEYLELTAPYSNPMLVDMSRCRRFAGGMIDCHVQYPLSTKDMLGTSVTVTGRYYLKDDNTSYEKALKRSSSITGVSGSQGLPEATIDTSGNRPPIADAGEDVTTDLTSLFNLNGLGSTDPDGDRLTYKWEQISGPRTRRLRAGATPSFWPTPGTRKFRLTVTDYHGLISAPDEVTITHEPRPEPPDCPLWGRDDIMKSVIASQPGGQGSSYSLEYSLKPQKRAQLQAESDRLEQLYPNFKTLEVKAVVSSTSEGSLLQAPLQASTNVAGAPPAVRRFESPVSPAPQLYWAGELFQERQYYQVKTTVALYDETGQEMTAATYPPECQSAEIYVLLVPMVGPVIGGSGFPIRGPLLIFTDDDGEHRREAQVNDFPKPKRHNFDPNNGPVPQ